MELLLAAGANPTLVNHDMGEGSTPLHAAAAGGQASILRLLLATSKLGSAVHQPAEHGFTPLHLAARRGSKECVQLLLDAGADAHCKSQAGKTALDLAVLNKRVAVVAVLEQAGCGQAPAG